MKRIKDSERRGGTPLPRKRGGKWQWPLGAPGTRPLVPLLDGDESSSGTPWGKPNQYFFFFFFFFYMGKCIAAPSAARGNLAAGVWGSPSRDVRWHDPRREYPLKPHGSHLRLSAGVTVHSASLYPQPRRAWARPITGRASPWPGSVTSPAERERGCLSRPLAAYWRVEACRVPEASTPAAACLPNGRPSPFGGRRGGRLARRGLVRRHPAAPPGGLSGLTRPPTQLVTSWPARGLAH